MANTTIVYVPVPATAHIPVARPHSVYEFTCTCGETLEIHSLDVSCLACRRSWAIQWQMPADDDGRPVLTCEDPECPAHD